MLKVLIADDEEDIRKGMQRLIDWRSCGYTICGEAEDGLDALQKIRSLQPDLVLLDIKMPRLSGIELLKAVASDAALRERKIHFLILSGFSDFEFAREAMNYGAQGYFVKPIDEDLLEEKVREIARDSFDLPRRFEQMFLFGSVDDAFEDDGGDNSRYLVALLCAERCGYGERPAELGGMLRNFFADRDMFTVLQDKDIIAVFRNCGDDAVERELQRFASRLSGQPFAVLGEAGTGLQGALDSYVGCRSRAGRLFFAADRELVTVRSSLPGDSAPAASAELKGQVPVLLACIESYDKVQLSAILAAERERLCSGGLDAAAVKTQCIAYLVELQTTLEKKYPERSFSIASAFDLVPRLMAATRFAELFSVVEEVTMGYLEVFNMNTGSSTIVKLVQYVRANYMKELKLEALGAMFYSNSAYLGKKFKEYTGEPFNTYIDKLRIEDAKKKLAETELKVYQISEMLGYANTDYFFMKFKKYTGMTPKEYRRSLRPAE